mmetsp:Transcript_3643/g.14613  ORF Transcript_3643/g.14613 Transcript_3643/m.14613 type:complete len:627 (+) Transcript_3643:1566-3446(+)
MILSHLACAIMHSGGCAPFATKPNLLCATQLAARGHSSDHSLEEAASEPPAVAFAASCIATTRAIAAGFVVPLDAFDAFDALDALDASRSGPRPSSAISSRSDSAASAGMSRRSAFGTGATPRHAASVASRSPAHAFLNARRRSGRYPGSARESEPSELSELSAAIRASREASAGTASRAAPGVRAACVIARRASAAAIASPASAAVSNASAAAATADIALSSFGQPPKRSAAGRARWRWPRGSPGRSPGGHRLSQILERPRPPVRLQAAARYRAPQPQTVHPAPPETSRVSAGRVVVVVVVVDVDAVDVDGDVGPFDRDEARRDSKIASVEARFPLRRHARIQRRAFRHADRHGTRRDTAGGARRGSPREAPRRQRVASKPRRRRRVVVVVEPASEGSLAVGTVPPPSPAGPGGSGVGGGEPRGCDHRVNRRLDSLQSRSHRPRRRRDTAQVPRRWTGEHPPIADDDGAVGKGDDGVLEGFKRARVPHPRPDGHHASHGPNQIAALSVQLAAGDATLHGVRQRSHIRPRAEPLALGERQSRRGDSGGVNLGNRRGGAHQPRHRRAVIRAGATRRRTFEVRHHPVTRPNLHVLQRGPNGVHRGRPHGATDVVRERARLFARPRTGV